MYVERARKTEKEREFYNYIDKKCLWYRDTECILFYSIHVSNVYRWFYWKLRSFHHSFGQSAEFESSNQQYTRTDQSHSYTHTPKWEPCTHWHIALSWHFFFGGAFSLSHDISGHSWTFNIMRVSKAASQHTQPDNNVSTFQLFNVQRYQWELCVFKITSPI